MKTWQEKSKEAMKADWKMVWQGCLVRDLTTGYWRRVITVYCPNMNDWHFLGIKAGCGQVHDKQTDVYLDLVDEGTVGCIQRAVEGACNYYELDLSWKKTHRPDMWTVSIVKNEMTFYSKTVKATDEAALGILALDALTWVRGYEE